MLFILQQSARPRKYIIETNESSLSNFIHKQPYCYRSRFQTLIREGKETFTGIYIPTHTTPFHVISIVQIADVHLAGKDQRNARVLIPLFNKAISIVSTVYKPLYSSHTSRPLGGTPICILSTRILSFQVGENLTFTNLSKMSSYQ